MSVAAIVNRFCECLAARQPDTGSGYTTAPASEAPVGRDQRVEGAPNGLIVVATFVMAALLSRLSGPDALG